MLVHPKDKAKKSEICGLIYHIQWGGKHEHNCSHDYIGETERRLKSRFIEHRRPSSTTSEVSKHINIVNPGHEIILDQVKILDRESSWYERGVKEAIYIRALMPSLNRDGSRFQLSYIWDSLLHRSVSDVDQSVASQLKKSIVHGRNLPKVSFLIIVYVILKF